MEVINRPGGRTSGGGRLRPEAIYREEERKQIQKSNENQDIQHLCTVFPGQPPGGKSHHLPHAHCSK